MQRKILVVDDDEGMRDNLVDILEDEGYLLFAASNCSEAITLAETHCPHAALLDLKLPDDSGLNLMADLKNINADCICVLITAYADLDSAITALDKGAFQYLQKPVRTPELIRLLERIFDIVQIREEKNQAEQKLRESEERFRTIFETARDGIFLKDKDLKYTLVNPSMERFNGINAIEFIGKTDEELFPDMVNEHKKQIENRVLNGEIVEEEEERLSNGMPRTYHSIKVPMVGNSLKINGLCAFTRDITDTRQLEAQLLQAQKMEAVGILAGGISHDFNNLLQAILGYSQMLLLEKPEYDPDVGKLQEIENAANRAKDLIKQLLTFSRKVESKLRPIDLNHEVKQVQKLLTRTIPKMIQIELNLQEGIHNINGDPGQIEQVLLNICVNANDAMSEGGKLVIRTSNIYLDEDICKILPDARPGDHALLAIEDTGHGMDKKAIQHVFDPFFSTKPVGRGTGLGMAMAYGIIKNHNGAITCESKEGVGTTFKIYLPAVKESVKKVYEPKKTQVTKGNGETVLIIEDEEVLRNLLKKILTLNGYDVLTAENGEAGLEIYKKESKKIDLIVLDMIMPGMGGKQCMKDILEINPESKILIASGYTSKETKKDTLLMGAKGFIEKPYDFHDILSIMQDTMD